MLTQMDFKSHWPSFLFRPKMIQKIIKTDPYSGVSLLVILSCSSLAAVVMMLFVPENLVWFAGQDFLIPWGFGLVFGIPLLYAVGYLLYSLTIWMGGDISVEEVRSVIAWAAAPSALYALPWFSYEFIHRILNLGTLVYYQQIFLALWVLSCVWGLVILIPTLSNIGKLSVTRSIIVIILDCIIIALMLIGGIVSLVMGLQLNQSWIENLHPQAIAAALTSLAVLLLIMGLQRQNQSEVQRAEALLAAWRPGVLPDLEALELAKPWEERLFRPLWERLRRYGTGITPADKIRELQKQLIRAGRPYNMGVTDFLGLRLVISAVMGVGMFLIAPLVASSATPSINRVLLTIVGFSLGLYFPTYWLKGRIRKRQKEIQRALPDALDMLTICVDAGLGFDAALQRVATYWDNAFAQELNYMLHEMRVGVRRVEALRHLADRTDVPDLASLVALLTQADRLGVPLSNVLKSQSQQLRLRRRQRAEEEAHKAPVKMLLPLSLFILPATMAVVLGPAIPRFAEMMDKF